MNLALVEDLFQCHNVNLVQQIWGCTAARQFLLDTKKNKIPINNSESLFSWGCNEQV
jgi:hypothetical protein